MTAYAPRSSLNYAARPSCKFYNSCGCRYGKDCRFVHAPHEHSVNGIILEELHVIKSAINTSHHMFMQHYNAMQIELDRMKMEMEMKKEEIQQQQEQQLCIASIQTNDAALHQQPSQCMKCDAASKQQQQQQRQLDELQIEIKRLKKELKEEKKKKKKEVKHVAMQTNAATLNQQQQQQQLQQIKALQIENEKLKEEMKTAKQTKIAALKQQQRQQQQFNVLQIENKKVKKELIDIKKKNSKPPQCNQCKAASKKQQQLKQQQTMLQQQCNKYEEELKQQQQQYQALQHENNAMIALQQQLTSQVAAIQKEKDELKVKLDVFVLRKMQCIAVQTDGDNAGRAQQQHSVVKHAKPQQQQLNDTAKHQQQQQWNASKLYQWAAEHGESEQCYRCGDINVEWMCMECKEFVCNECVCCKDKKKIAVRRICNDCDYGEVEYYCHDCGGLSFMCTDCKYQHQQNKRFKTHRIAFYGEKRLAMFDKFGDECNHCGKTGHWARECQQ